METTIKKLRKQTGLSQYKFAAKFGMNPINISCWERGTRKPPEYVINMIETILEQEKTIKKLERKVRKQ